MGILITLVGIVAWWVSVVFFSILPTSYVPLPYIFNITYSDDARQVKESIEATTGFTGSWGIYPGKIEIGPMRVGAIADTWMQDMSNIDKEGKVHPEYVAHKKGDAMGIGINNGTNIDKAFKFTLVNTSPCDIVWDINEDWIYPRSTLDVIKNWISLPSENFTVKALTALTAPISLSIPENAIIPYKSWWFEIRVEEATRILEGISAQMSYKVNYISRWTVNMRQ